MDNISEGGDENEGTQMFTQEACHQQKELQQTRDLHCPSKTKTKYHRTQNPDARYLNANEPHEFVSMI